MISHEYSQGVCQNGAAILKNGQMMTIEEILAELNNHERLVEALWHAMQCWEYDGVSDEHGAVAKHCSDLLSALEAEKGGE